MQARLWCHSAMLGLCALCLGGERAQGKKIREHARPAVFLENSEQFIAQESPWSYALYRARDGKRLRRFVSRGDTSMIDVSSDEGLLVACAVSDHVVVWDIQTGEKLWELEGTESKLGGIVDVSFAQDGKSF